VCELGTCSHEWVDDCCSSIADCPKGPVCLGRVCVNFKCGLALVPPPECCLEDSDCEVTDACTALACENFSCTQPAPTVASIIGASKLHEMGKCIAQGRPLAFVDAFRYPLSALHIESAVAAGHPREVTIQSQKNWRGRLGLADPGK
jgi:hypothetical protein